MTDSKNKKPARSRSWKVWAIMDGDKCTGIAYPGSTQKEARDYECRAKEKPVAAILTLSPCKKERK